MKLRQKQYDFLTFKTFSVNGGVKICLWRVRVVLGFFDSVVGSWIMFSHIFSKAFIPRPSTSRTSFSVLNEPFLIFQFWRFFIRA